MVRFIPRICSSCGTENRVPPRHAADTGRCGKCKAPLPPSGEPIDADPELFEEIVSSVRVPILVDFWAPWCGPCRTAAPIIEKLAAETPGKAVVLKVDTERHPGLAQEFNVMAIPTFIVLKDGRVVSRQAGVVDGHQMKRWLDQAEAKPVG